MSRFFKSAAFPILIVVVLAFFAQKLISPGPSGNPPQFGDFQSQLSQGQVKVVDVRTKDNTLEVNLNDKRKYEVGYPDDYANTLIRELDTAKQTNRLANYDVQVKKSNGWLSQLTYILPFLIFIGFWIFLMNQVQGGGSKALSFGKSKAKRRPVHLPTFRCREVAGLDEAVEELHEIKEFLENPQKFQALGARIPKG